MRGLAVAFAVLATGCGGAQLAWRGHTPDRAHTVDVRQQGGLQWLVVDGRASRAYRFIAAHDLAFGGAGHVAFAAETSETPESWSVVVDFVEGRTWDGVTDLRFGPGGKRFAYAALQRGRWQCVVDGAPQRAFEAVDSIDFSPDGTRVGYVAHDGECSRTVVDGVVGVCTARVVGLSLANDPRGDVRLLADSPDGSAAHLFVGDEHVRDFPGALELDVDPGATRWAVLARDDRGESIVVAGASSAPHAAIEPPVFSANGAHVGYVTHDGDHSAVVVDDRVVEARDAPITGLAFSDDGARTGWFYRDGAMSGVTVDGHRFPFEVVIERTLRFSRDGRHWGALVGSRTDRRLFITVDGTTSLAVDGEEIFDGDSRNPGARLSTLVAGELDRYLGAGS